MREPTTADEWRQAARLAEVLLDVEAAQRYGLITGGPEVNIAHCVDVLKRARQRGIVPRSEDVNATTAALVRELCERP